MASREPGSLFIVYDATTAKRSSTVCWRRRGCRVRKRNEQNKTQNYEYLYCTAQRPQDALPLLPAAGLATNTPNSAQNRTGKSAQAGQLRRDQVPQSPTACQLSLSVRVRRCPWNVQVFPATHTHSTDPGQNREPTRPPLLLLSCPSIRVTIVLFLLTLSTF